MFALRRTIIATTLFAAVAIGTACGKKPETAPTPVATDSTAIKQHIADSLAALARQRSADSAAAARRAADEAARQQHLRDSIANAERLKRDADAAAAAAIERDMAAMRTTMTTPVHFDYDKADLTNDTKAALDAKIPILKANSGLMIRVAGNTDERGSEEYNLALGKRRADAAKAYLVSRGVSDGQIEVISNGENNKVCEGHDDSCWSQNRRDEFEITGGGNMIKKP